MWLCRGQHGLLSKPVFVPRNAPDRVGDGKKRRSDMAKQSRVQRRIKPKHRAVKPRVPRSLDVAQENNHAARHAAKKQGVTSDQP